MICQPCREAGEYNRQANTEPGQATRGALLARAAELHRECKSQQCPCRHRLGQWLNKAAK